MAVSFSLVRKLALALPGVEERVCHDTPAFYVRKKIFGRLQEDGETLSLAYPKARRDELIERHPDVFSVTAHFKNYDYVLVNLHAAGEPLLREHLAGAWRMKAIKKALTEFDGSQRV
jgi:hypothetical protein